MNLKTLIIASILLSLVGCSESKTNDANPKSDSTVTQTKDASKTASESKNYLAQGKKYALATKKVLGKNLKKAMKAGGPVSALSFCNARAYPLTDSMSTANNIYIKRVSDQYRNPANKANTSELEYIENVKKNISSGATVKPQMQEIDGKMTGYYPIMTGGLCLKCHGTPEKDINSKTMSKLSKLYPEDKATGYSENELRGIWVIAMDK